MAEGDDSETPDQPKLRVRPSVEERTLLEGPSPSGGLEDAAAQEAKQLSSGRSVRDIRREAEESDHDRSENFRDHFEKAIIFMMWVVMLGFLGLALVWAINMCIHTDLRWLTEDQMHDLQGVLTGGLLIGLVGDHVKRRMNLNQIGAGS